jgi:hypothetical protein
VIDPETYEADRAILRPSDKHGPAVCLSPRRYRFEIALKGSGARLKARIVKRNLVILQPADALDDEGAIPIACVCDLKPIAHSLGRS